MPSAVLLIADPDTADLVVRLTSDRSLVREVNFFLDALQTESGQPSQAPERGP